MTRAALTSRIQSKVRRTDVTTLAQIKTWIDEIIAHVERQIPFQYTKKPQEATLAAESKSFTLPAGLILHHSFTLLLKDATNASNPTYRYLVKTSDETKEMQFPNPEFQADKALYWTLVGKDDGLGFDIWPVMNAAEVLRIASGHFYTGAWSVDGDNNWLSNNHPWLIIEGASYLCFEEYGQPAKADRATALFDVLLEKARVEQMMMEETGRMKKIKLLSDIPVDTGSKIKTYGF